MEEVSDHLVPSGDTQEKDSVSYSTHRKLLEQRKKDQANLDALSLKLRELEAEKNRIEEEKLRQSGDIKALLESRERQLKERDDEVRALSSQNEEFKKTLNDAVKLNAFQSKLGGKLKKSEYLGFVDTSKIPIDPDTGRVDDKAAEQYANEFVNTYKELISFDKSGSLPNGQPKPSDSLSYEAWLRLPIKEKQARYKDVVNKK